MTNPDREELVKLDLFTPNELAVRLDEWALSLDKSQMDLRSDMRCAAIHLRRLASSDSGVKGEPEPVADWRDDPTSDERWNAGCDFAMTQLCKALDVDPAAVNWDAATETVDGDVQSVIWNILRARMGEDWDPDAPPAPSVAVKAKALTWRDHRPDSFPEPAWSAETPFGFYRIEEVSASDSPAYVVRLHAHHFIADKDSLEEAKAAAQSDYEKRVRSCIPTTPEDDSVARVLSELRDRRLLNDVDDGLHEEIAESLIKAVRG